MPPAFLARQMEWHEALTDAESTDEVNSARRRRGRAPAPTARRRSGPTWTSATMRPLRSRNCASGCFSRGCAKRSSAASKRWSTDVALLQLSEPGQSPDPHSRRVAVGIDLGTTHSLVATLRHGHAESLRDREGRVLLPSIVRYRGDGRRRHRPGRSGRAGRRSGAHDRLGQAIDGAKARRSARRRQAALSLGRRRRHGAHRNATRREVAGGGLGANPGHAAPTRGGFVRQRLVRRGHHRASLLRRCTATSHERRGRTGGPEGAAFDQRAHRGSAGLRPRQRQRRPVSDLRPRWRHLRRVVAAPVARRVRGGGHRWRLGTGWRRLRPRAGVVGTCARRFDG